MGLLAARLYEAGLNGTDRQMNTIMTMSICVCEDAMTFFDPEKHPEMEPPKPNRDDAAEDDFIPDIRKMDWVTGDRVLAPWGQAWLFPGTVGEVAPGEVFVYFDDGNRGWAPKDQVKPLQMITVGCRVHCRWKAGTEYYSGIITQMNAEQIFIQYDDGDSEWSTIGMICVPSGLSPSLWEYALMILRSGWMIFLLALCLWRGWSCL